MKETDDIKQEINNLDIDDEILDICNNIDDNIPQLYTQFYKNKISKLVIKKITSSTQKYIDDEKIKKSIKQSIHNVSKK